MREAIIVKDVEGMHEVHKVVVLATRMLTSSM
jgi:hypothetical protein